MNEPKDSSKGNREAALNSLLVTATLLYGVMAAVGLLVSFYVHKNLISNFWLDQAKLFQALASGCLAAGILLVLNFFFENYFAQYKQLRVTFVHLLGPLAIPFLLYLALLSALGEEILFRGAIQPAVGIIGTSVLFGLLHLGPEGKISSWSFWALIAGLVLGWIYDRTTSLWGPILGHFLVNSLSMIRLRLIYLELSNKEKNAAQVNDNDKD